MTWTSCGVYYEDVRMKNAWYHASIDSFLYIPVEVSKNGYIIPNEEKVCYLHHVELDLSNFHTPSWDFPMFDCFTALAVRWSVFDRQYDDPTCMQYDEEFSDLVLPW
jgi:hypothetical protein